MSKNTSVRIPAKPFAVFSRRLAAAVVLPRLLTTGLVLARPAMAVTPANASVCNGVANQLTHREADKATNSKVSASAQTELEALRQAAESAATALAGKEAQIKQAGEEPGGCRHRRRG